MSFSFSFHFSTLKGIDKNKHTPTSTPLTSFADSGVTYPKLALLLRYLAFTHTMLRAQEGGTSSSSDAEIESLVERLLCGERDPPPFPPESHSFPVQVHSQNSAAFPTAKRLGMSAMQYLLAQHSSGLTVMPCTPAMKLRLCILSYTAQAKRRREKPSRRGVHC